MRRAPRATPPSPVPWARVLRSPRACSLLAGLVSLVGGNTCTASTVPDEATFRETDAAPRDKNISQ
jgi:hypothetical protein